jgi:hypothetical protein
MTLRYVLVVQLDLQRKFHRSRQNNAAVRSIPQLPLPSPADPAHTDLPTARQAIATVGHLLQLLHLQLVDPGARRKVRRLTQRILNVGRELDNLTAK